MSVLTDRITEVVRVHEWSPDEPFEGLGRCACDTPWYRWEEWAVHVAEAVEVAIQKRSEMQSDSLPIVSEDGHVIGHTDPNDPGWAEFFVDQQAENNTLRQINEEQQP